MFEKRQQYGGNCVDLCEMAKMYGKWLTYLKKSPKYVGIHLEILGNG